MSGHPDVVFVLGGPGAGKGTQCQFIVKVSVYQSFKTNIMDTYHCHIFASFISAVLLFVFAEFVLFQVSVPSKYMK